MSRTAKTTAITHDGKDVLISGKTVSIGEQKKTFYGLKVLRVHEEYREINYQESDGAEEVIRLLNPEAHAVNEKRRADEQATADAAGRAQKEKVRLAKLPAGANQPPLASETPEQAQAQAKAKAKFAKQLMAKPRGELLQIIEGLVKSGQLKEPPAKTSKGALIEAILSAPLQLPAQ